MGLLSMLLCVYSPRQDVTTKSGGRISFIRDGNGKEVVLGSSKNSCVYLGTRKDERVAIKCVPTENNYLDNDTKRFY